MTVELSVAVIENMSAHHIISSSSGEAKAAVASILPQPMDTHEHTSFRRSALNCDIRLMEVTSTVEQCRVCGDASSGRHYGAVTCEGCKGFFRRIIINGNERAYTCQNRNECVISQTNRRKCCKSCRFAKCMDVGMDPKHCVKLLEMAANQNNAGVEGERREEMEAIRAQIVAKFNESFAELVDNFDHNINGEIPDEFLLSASRLEIESSVQQFVCGVRLFRQIDGEQTKLRMIGEALTEVLVVLLALNCFKRYENYMSIVFGNFQPFRSNDIDNEIRAIANTFKERPSPDNDWKTIAPLLVSLIIADPNKVLSDREKSQLANINLSVRRAFGMTGRFGPLKHFEIREPSFEVNFVEQKVESMLSRIKDIGDKLKRNFES